MIASWPPADRGGLETLCKRNSTVSMFDGVYTSPGAVKTAVMTVNPTSACMSRQAAEPFVSGHGTNLFTPVLPTNR